MNFGRVTDDDVSIIAVSRKTPTCGSAAPVFIVVFGLPGQHGIFYANGRTIIHCLPNVKRKVRPSSNCSEGRGEAAPSAVLAGGKDRGLPRQLTRVQDED
jgi:hypothetical protein